MGSYRQIIATGITLMAEMQAKNEKKLDEIQEEWFRSASYPRKKKKKVRKQLLVEWNIFSYAADMFKF